MKKYSIKGRVADAHTGNGIQGLNVEAWSIRKDAKDPLTTAVTKKSGSFKFSTENADEEALAQLRKLPKIRLRIYDGSVLLRGGYLEKVYSLIDWDNDIVIEVSDEGPVKPGEMACTVQGVVYDPTGVPVQGLTVTASNQGLRSATALGKAQTDETGQYSIRYTSDAKEGSAELSMEVANTGGTVVYQSTVDSILYNAPQHAKLDIHLATDPRPQTIEFNTIGATLTALTKGLSFDQLGETTQYPDISYLSNETGIDYSLLSYFVLSYKVQQQFQLLPAFTYALLREGALQTTDLSRILNSRTTITVSTDITGLAYDIALLPTAQIQQATTLATTKYVTSDISKQLPGILAQLGKLQQAAQNYTQNVRPQQWINTVAASLSSGAYKGLTDALGKNYYGDLPGLFNAIVNANPFPAAGNQPQAPLNLDLGTLLKGLPTAPARPANAGPATDPTHAAFLKSFENDAKHLFPAKDKMLDALRRAPGANLGSGSIDAQVKHLQLPEETRSGLRKLQRLYKLTPHYQQAKALHKDGIHSAYHIVALGKKQFVRKYTKNNTFSEKEATRVYNKASTTHTAALMLAGELRDYAGLSQMKNLGGAQAAKAIQAVNKNFPNLKSLFGESDYCECSDCRNVWSPAAYVVDVLQFLKNRLVMGGTKTAKDILFTRRPDLGDLDLNCDNAYTELPYIDLVCEILEDAVSSDPGLALDGSYTADLVPGAVTAHLLAALQGAGYQATTAAFLYPSYVEGIVTTFILRDAMLTLKISQSGAGWIAKELRQTHLSQQELAAAPEYVNSAAYTQLSTSTASFSLPFDLFQEQAESLLETVGIHRSDLMTAFQTGAGPTATDIAAVALGISPADATLIDTADLVNQAKYWNTSPSNPLTVVNEVDIFLQKSGIAYTDLQNLLTQSFINPTGNIYIKHLDSTCDTSEKDLINLDVNALDRMHRFIRLWNKTGLPMDDLNAVISYPALGNNTLDGNVLIYLSGLQNLVNTLGISFDQALSFYGGIPDDSATALYQTVFLNLIRTNPLDSAFTLVNILANEALAPGTQDTLANHLATLCLCLKRPATDVNFLIAQLVTGPLPVPPLTRANLAYLYSNCILASSLGMSLTDMYGLSALAGQPLSGTPAATITFIQTVREVQNSGLAVSDLQWYLTGQDPTGLRAITDAKVTGFLVSLQNAYQAAFASTASPFDTNATPTENLNGLKQMLGNLPPNPPGSAPGSAPVLTTQVVNQIVSIANDTWTDTSAAAQTLIASALGNYFSAAAITQLQAEANTVLTGGGLPADENTLIGDLCANASLFLYTTAKNAALYATVDSVFGTTDAVTQTILNNAALHFPPPGIGGPPTLLRLLTDDSLVDRVNTPPVPPPVIPATFDLQYRATRLLNMIVGFTNSFSPTGKDLQWFLQNNATMGWLAIDQLKYQGDAPAVAWPAWVAFSQVQQLMTKYPPVADPANPTATLEWTDVWNQVLGLTGLPALQTALATFTGWNPTDLGALIAYFGYTYPGTVAGIPASSFGNPATYLQLDQTTALLRMAGMATGDMTQVIQPVLGQAQVNLITVALRNKYSEAQWLSVIQPVMNALRPQKRDALVTYLLATNPSLTGTDDLYDYFLVDAEMQPIMLTSRIVLAHGTLQLYIQRCLMGLEPQATADLADDDGWEQWTWMANYQVWVANRKIFLYPENWFAPELRTNMSYFFSDLMSTLQQNQITDDNVQTAALAYLDDLDDVANLDVRACYYDVKTYIFHVIARVRGSSSYYYRTCTNENSWSAWTLVNVDVSGDCLLCFVRNSRLYMAWPLFTEDTLQGQSITVPSSGDSVAPQAPWKRYEIQLAVSEYTDGTWQPKRVSQDTLLTDYYPNNTYQDADLASMQDSFRMINFDLGTAGDDIVCSFGDDSIGGPVTLGTFALTGCKGYPQAVNFSGDDIPDYELIPQFEYTDFLQMQYRQETGTPTTPPPPTGFIARTIFNPFNFNPILAETPSPYQVVYPHEFSLLDYIYILLEILTRQNETSEFARQKGYVFPMASFMPFFFEDSDRDYVIIPGFFNQDSGETQTFSDIYQFVLNVIALIKKYIAIFLADPTHNVGNLITELLNDPTFQDLWQQWLFYSSTQPQLLFRNFYHPLVCSIKSMVNTNGLPSIYEYSFQKTQTSFDFNNVYQPATAPNVPSVALPYPVEDLDFNSFGSYALYNWELFYHLPFYVANQLSQNQQFDDATTWYHYIFNPTGGQGDPAPQNYWITKPFHEFLSGDYLGDRIDTIMNKIAADPTGASISNLVTAINNWRSQPFLPDVVASTRQVAYQKALFIAYIKHLIAYGDYLFTQNTTETRVQATNLYVLADELMGPQPSTIPPAVPVPDETYNQLEHGIDLFGNALIDMENLVPDLNVLPQKGNELPPSASFSMLYFCIPANDELTTLWSTIANRLYNLRNSNDINGNFTSVALFAPPIDPGLLARAAAGGLDISSIIADLNAPLPYYRFRIMSAKATELATQVANLGNALLAALEKKDAEMLSQLRSGQEIALQTQILLIRTNQINEANAAIVELKAAKAISEGKFDYYSSREFMNGWEITQAVLSGAGIISQVVATVLDGAAGGLSLVPEISGGGAGFGGTPTITLSFGGGNLGGSAGNFASLFRDLGDILQSTAGIIGNIGSYQRRMDDWNFQAGQATLELADYDQKIAVAGINVDIATGERDTQQTRINQAIAVDKAIHTKYTNEALYSWMISQISGVYYQAYQLAYSIAKQAEHCYQYELASDNSFIQFGYWNSQQKGLLAGDQLLAAIKQMEASYLDTNRREYELTKNISVASLNPRALLQLINTGSCDFDIPEFYFDMDYPGQYLRRIKTVAVTIPCVAGPLTTVACTLTLVNNEYRKSPLLSAQADPYAENPVGGDSRFVYGTGFIQAIALSRAQNDNGLFELNFEDERYLPFEGLGAISSWHLEMNDPAAFAQFDYQTITDVILQLKYTARDAGSQLRAAASKSLMGVLKTIADQAPPAGLFRAFDLKHDFPNNWYAFMTDGSGTYNLDLSKLNFPFYTQNNLLKISVEAIGLFIQTSAAGALQVGIAGAAPVGLTTNAAVFGADIQFIDSVTSFVPVLKKATDTGPLALAVSNFATVGSQITGAWLIVNYDLS